MRKPKGRNALRDRGVNPRLKLCPLAVARAVVPTNPALHERGEQLLRILDDISSGATASAAKSMLDPFEFIGDRPTFLALRQWNATIGKIPWKGDIDQRAAAMETWLQSEARCKDTNERFKSFPSGFSPNVVRVLELARLYVHRCIGELTGQKYWEIIRLSGPGGGVSIGTRSRERVAPVFKYLDSDVVATPGAIPIARDFYSINPKLLHTLERKEGRIGVRTRRTNRVSFVPKSMKTLRAIAVEPSFNIMIQLGIHRYWTHVFKKRRVAHLDDQELNQLLAYVGSRNEGLFSLSTLDLASASDTLSRELVRWLLPESWYHFLDSLRCDSSHIKGVGDVVLEKFSSMGNGFTFALETLIFKALAEGVRRLCGGEVTSVYGDDIIVPTSNALFLAEVLEACGFKLNSEKSFVLGPFKESCGADWLHGECVTPVYLRKQVLRARDAYAWINTIDTLTSSKPLFFEALRESNALRFGLENEDPGSCVFAPLAYCKGGGMVTWSVDLQTWTFTVVREYGVEYRREIDTFGYQSALLSGCRSLPIKGRTRCAIARITAGRPVGVQRLKRVSMQEG